MAKTLNQFLEGYLKVKNPDEQKFVDKHVVAKHSDRNGNGDEVFKGSKVKMDDRRKTRHGYNPGEDEKVYEELKGSQHKIDANKNGKVDAHDLHLLRKKKKVAEEAEGLDETFLTPNAHAEFKNMPKDAVKRHHDVYVSTAATFKKNGSHALSAAAMGAANEIKRKYLGEEAEELEELSTATLQSYRKKARAQGNAIVDKMKMGGGDWSKDQKDTKTLRKRAAGAQASGKQLVKRGESLKTEETEQLDELSPSTMGAYTKKAAADFRARKPKMGYDGQLKKMQNRSVGVGRALKKMYGEEAEQIDELSTDTMKRYQDKARTSADALRDKGFRGNAPAWKKAQNRSDSIDRAQSKIKARSTNEEAEQIDEISQKLAGAYHRKSVGDLLDNPLDTARKNKRRKGINMASSKTMGDESKIKARVHATEEAEQIDELSRSTLRRYRMKAKSIGDNEKGDIGYRSKGRDLAARKTHGGQFGIPKAKVMASEEADKKRRAMAIAAKLTAERGGKPLRKEEKLADLLGDLTESHRRTMLSVFDKLNESNQKKFLEACETPEGVDSMLDFAISHRGE